VSALQPAQAAKPGGGGGGSTTGNIGLKIQGYDKLSKSWTPGNTAGYAEHQDIPFRIILTGAGTLATLQIVADHFRDPAPGIEDLRHFQICTGAPTTTPPGATSCSPVPIGAPGPNGGTYVTQDVPDRVVAGVVLRSYTFHNVTVTSSGLVLTWDALLAIGSHLYPGSALHMAVGTATGATSSDTISFGSKDVPIPVNGIIATETDKTVNGQDPYTTATLHEIVTVQIVSSAFGPAKGTQTLTIRDELPACLDYQEGTATAAFPFTDGTSGAPGGVLSWTYPNVKNGTTKTVTFKAEIVQLGGCTNVAFTHSDQVPDDSRDDVDITVHGVPDVAPVKDCTDTVVPGGTAQCTITYTNNGTEPSQPGTVRDVLDAGLVFVPGTPLPSSGPTTDPNTGKTTVVWNIPALAPGDGGVITYGEKVPDTGTAGQHQYADTATTIVPGDDDDSDTEIVTVTYTPDLFVSKACPTSASPGGQATYTISYGNGGTAASAAGAITDTIPAGMTYVSSSRTPTTQSGQTVSWSLPNGVPAMTNGQSFTLTVSVGGAGPFTNKVDITPLAGDANQADNHFECSTGLDYTDIGISKGCPSAASPDAVVTHTLSFSNTGNQPAPNVVVTDTLGAGLTRTNTAPTYVLNGGAPTPSFQQTGQVLKWTFSSLPAGSSGTISYQVHIDNTWSSAGVQHLVDSVTISSDSTIEKTGAGSNPNSDSCTTDVDFEPHLTIDKSGCRSVVVPGGFQTYTITYRNDGHAPATGVVITDQPPANQPIASVTGPGSNVDKDTNTATWTIGTLNPGPAQSVTLTVVVNAEDGAIVSNTASISGSPSVSASALTQTTVSGVGRHAKATGYSLGVKAIAVLLDPALTTSTAEAPPSPSDDVTGLPSVGVPGVLSAGLLTTTAHAETGVGIASATHTTEVLNLQVLGALGPLVTADAVRTVATSVAGPLGAQSSSLGTASANLLVGGTTYNLANVPPNTIVDLSPLAKVTLNAVTKTAGLDGSGNYTTSIDIDAIKVELLSLLGAPTVVVTVGHSHAEASYPSGAACGVQPSTVSARAYTAHVKGLTFVEAWLNDAEITPLGSMPGEDANAATATIPTLLSAGAVTNHAEGVIGSAPHSYAHSKVVGLNLLGGLITADVLDMESTSNAGGGSASTSLSAIFLNLRVNGTGYSAPLPNQVINIPMGGEIVHLVLNEQFLIGNGTTDTEGTVNAIHLQVFNAVGALKTDVVVASAHSDAHLGG
jgi:uncharacterized repeat protein (TIGR01451 family)